MKVTTKTIGIVLVLAAIAACQERGPILRPGNGPPITVDSILSGDSATSAPRDSLP